MKKVSPIYTCLFIVVLCCLSVTGCNSNYIKLSLSRPAGIVLDKSVYIVVDNIEGREGELFKKEVLERIRSDLTIGGQLITRSELSDTTRKHLDMSGVVTICGNTQNEYNMESEKGNQSAGQDDKEYYIKRYTMSFGYIIRHFNSGDTVSSGRIVDADETKDQVVTAWIFTLTSRDQDFPEHSSL